jgi:hypothetical protein
MQEFYELEAAAALLGVKPETLISLSNKNLLETEEQEGHLMVPKKEIIRLFDKVSDDDADPTPEKATVKEKVPNAPKKKPKEEAPEKDTPGIIVIDDEKLKAIHQERDDYRTKANNLVDRINRLQYKVALLKTMEAGENAKFWHLASLRHPEIVAGNFVCEEYEDQLLVRPSTAKDAAEEKIEKIKGSPLPDPIKKALIEGIKRGEDIPPWLNQFFGIDE